ncbi:MFS transporter [Metabacillus fastidiosus]|uniref:MFS transporter n=1 Tax=Metabacillus fastidiosus TaxID=1458 RepID=UPI002E1BF332|nr:MFS transporter [Metabacillus fastidiosus]
MVNMFITMVGIGLIIPILPKFLLGFGVGGQEMGYLVAAFALTQFLFSPVAGEMADRHGRRIIILLGIFIFSISQLIFAVGTEMWMLYISRLLGGIGAAFVVPPMMAYVADITTEDEREKGMGMLSAAMTLGFVIGPGVGGFLADFGLRVPLYCSGIIAGLATLATFLFLKETLATEDRLKVRVGEKKQENIFTQLVK